MVVRVPKSNDIGLESFIETITYIGCKVIYVGEADVIVSETSADALERAFIKIAFSIKGHIPYFGNIVEEYLNSLKLLKVLERS